MEMSPETVLWTLFATIGSLIGSLAAVIIVGLRKLRDGGIVAGRHYEDARKDEARWQAAAETALETNRELASHLGRLTSAIEQLTATARETQHLTQQLVNRIVAVPPEHVA